MLRSGKEYHAQAKPLHYMGWGLQDVALCLTSVYSHSHPFIEQESSPLDRGDFY